MVCSVISVSHQKICQIEPGLYRPAFRAYRAASPSDIALLPQESQEWAAVNFGGREAYKRVDEVMKQNLSMSREQLLSDLYHESVLLKALDNPVFKGSKILQAAFARGVTFDD